MKREAKPSSYAINIIEVPNGLISAFCVYTCAMSDSFLVSTSIGIG